jgi:hypothetical protein
MARTTDRLPHLLRAGAIGALAAAVGNAVIYGIGRATDVSYAYIDGGDELRVGLGEVVGASFLTFAIGLAAAAVVVWLGRPDLRIIQAIGGVIAVASTYTSFAIDASSAASFTLAAMHVVSGIAYIAALEAVRSPRQELAAAPA